MLIFVQLTEAIETYHITAENIYNWDEKGFIIGKGHKTKRIMNKQAYKKGQIRQNAQDGNREFISLLAAICADGTYVPPALIYQGASQDLQSSWMEDLQDDDEGYFTSSENGWTCDALGRAWLRKFHQETKKKAGNRRRLLIVDGHSSHINMEFLKLADSFKILICILPPHTTHRLQPLDIGLFGPLERAYSTHLDNFTFDGLGWVSMTKRVFWSVFKEAWKDSFTAKNIKKAFEKTGIWPLKAEITISKLPPPPETPATPSQLPSRAYPTPATARALRRLTKQPEGRARTHIIERAAFRLCTRNAILNHENRGLRRALGVEKRRTRRKAALGLRGQEKKGEAEFYGTEEVRQAIAYQATKEAQELAEKASKAEKKDAAARLRQENARKKEEARVQKRIQRDMEKEAREGVKAAKQAAAQAAREERARKKQETAAAVASRKEQAAAARAARAAASERQAARTGKKRVPKVPVNARPNVRFESGKSAGGTRRVRKPSNRARNSNSTVLAATTLAAAPAAVSSTRSGRHVTVPSRFQQ